MKLGKTGKGLITLLCLLLVVFMAVPASAANVDVGPGAQAGNGSTSTDNVAVGQDAKAGIGDNSNGNVAVGNNAQAGSGDNQSNNTAIGNNALAAGNNATAIGLNASATADNSVAIGTGSQTGTRSNTVSVGAPGAERQIINVADGVAPTDAVNVRQLNSVSLRLDKVGALAAAMSGLAPLAYKEGEPTQGSIATGFYSGETAIAAGLYHYTNENVLLNAAYAFCGSEKMGRVGVSVRFAKAKAKEPAAPREPVTPTAPDTPVIPATPPEVQEPAPVVVSDEPVDLTRKG